MDSNSFAIFSGIVHFVCTEYDEEEEGPKQVNVTFARQKPEFMKKMQEQSFQHHTKKSLEERWIHTNYMPANSSQAEVDEHSVNLASNEKLNCITFLL